MRPLFAVLILAGIAAAQEPLPPLTLGERARVYSKATIGPGSLLGTALSASLDQLRDRPPEWQQGMEGYGRRAGYSLAGNAANHAIGFGVSALRHEDTRYVRSHLTSFWKRTGYAMVHTFRVPDGNGGSTIAISRLAGAYGAAFLANTWYPQRISTPGDALLRGTWWLAGDIGNSAFREFWPDLKRLIFRKR